MKSGHSNFRDPLPDIEIPDLPKTIELSTTKFEPKVSNTQSTVPKTLKFSKIHDEETTVLKSLKVSLSQLNKHLATRSYIIGYSPSNVDLELLKLIEKEESCDNFDHVVRWRNHVSSYEKARGDYVSKGFPRFEENVELSEDLLNNLFCQVKISLLFSLAFFINFFIRISLLTT